MKTPTLTWSDPTFNSTSKEGYVALMSQGEEVLVVSSYLLDSAETYQVVLSYMGTYTPGGGAMEVYYCERKDGSQDPERLWNTLVKAVTKMTSAREVIRSFETSPRWAVMEDPINSYEPPTDHPCCLKVRLGFCRGGREPHPSPLQSDHSPCPPRFG